MDRRDSIVIKTLARLLEVAVAFHGGTEACLSQVLPAEGSVGQCPALHMRPGFLDCTEVVTLLQNPGPAGDRTPNGHRPVG